jgi:hypothetical protein
VFAFNGLHTGFNDAGINLPVFIGEARELKTVSPSVFALLRSGNRRVTRRGKFVGSGSKRKYKHGSVDNIPDDLFKKAIAADLMDKFALQPLMADLAGLWDLSRHYCAEFERISQTAPVRVRNTYRYVGPSAQFTDSSTAKLFSNWERSATAWQLIKYDQLSKPPNRMLALFDMLGFDQPLEAAWNLLPWSFVADWFVDVQTFIRQFDGKGMVIPHTVLSSGWSVKTVQRLNAQFGISSAFGSSVPTFTNWASCKRTTYRRNKGVPTDLGQIEPFRVRLPTNGQWITLAELLVSRFAR